MAAVTLAEMAALDPHYVNVSLLLSGNGVNGSTVFSDNSFFKRPVTPFGNAQISTAQSKFGGSAMYFDGSGDQATIDLPGGLPFGSDDFTIEAFVYLTVSPTGGKVLIVGQGDLATVAGSSWVFYLAPVGATVLSDVYIGSSTYRVKSVTPALNTWEHVAYVRHDTTLSSYLKGTLVGSVPVVGNINNGYATYKPSIAGFANSSVNATGYINDLRITKGVARYTANFTPPTAEFPWLETSQIGARSLTNPIARRICAAPRALVAGGPVTAAFDDKVSRRNIYQGGTGQITGTVKEKNLPTNVPLHRRVCLVEEKTRVLVAETWSDSTTGNYTFDRIDPTRTYTVMSYDHTGLYRAVIADRLVPEMLP